MTASPLLDLDDDTLTLTGDGATLVFLDREVADSDRSERAQLHLRYSSPC